MQACSTPSGIHVPTQGARMPARLTRGNLALRPARRSKAPVAALDASAIDAVYQIQEFGLTIMGVGIVSTFAAGMAHTLRRAATTYTVAAATGVAGEAPSASAVAAAAPASAAAWKQQPVAVVEQSAPVAATTPAALVLDLADLKLDLQQAAAAAVAAVKSAAAAEPAPPAQPAASAPAAAANGAAVKPGLTVEEATQQVKDWISAWQNGGESKPVDALEFPSREAAPTNRVTEPSLPTSASAVLNAMTANAPVGATPVGEDGPASLTPLAEEKELTAVVAAAPAEPAEPDEPAGDASSAEKEAEYKARISAVMEESKQQQAAKAQRVAEHMRKRVVEMGVGYQSKIDALWQGYETKKAEEAALLAKSEAILASLAEREAEERRLQESIAEMEAARRRQVVEQEQEAASSLLGRILAFFQQIQRWLQQLWASLTGADSSGSAAGASA